MSSFCPTVLRLARVRHAGKRTHRRVPSIEQSAAQLPAHYFVATALISYFVIERRFSAIGRRRPRHPTLLTRLEEARGRPTGFDYLRLTLAVGVIFWHSFVVSYGMLWVHGAMGGLAKPFVSIVLPSFFALSGFLVMASFDRSNIIVFAGLRILRIGPALAVETIVSAVVIGALFTNEPLRAYFTDA